MYAKIKIEKGDDMKNGFTLIEVTVVVLLLGILTVFIVPRVSTIIGNNKSKVCNSIVISAEDAAKGYTYKYTNIVDATIASNGYFEITLLDLQREGLLDVDLKNPYTDESIPNTNVVKITKTGNIYEYTYMGDECK